MGILCLRLCSATVINKNGLRELLEIELNKEEQEKLNESCEIIKNVIENSIDSIIK